VEYKFSKAAPIKDKSNVAPVVQQFFSCIKAVSHDIENVWFQGPHVISNGAVTYTRHDSSQLTVPFVDIMKIGNDLILEYQLYADISQLCVANENV
jgi:hypothetical protein